MDHQKPGYSYLCIHDRNSIKVSASRYILILTLYLISVPSETDQKPGYSVHMLANPSFSKPEQELIRVF